MSHIDTGDVHAGDTDAAPPPRPVPSHGWWTGRSGLVIPLILAAFSTYLVIGNLTMHQPAKVE